MTTLDVDPVEDAGDRDDSGASEGDGSPDDLTVEAVDTIPAVADAPEYVLYGGKGGVGKTTMAAATALSSAAAGTATLVVSTDPAHSLSDTLETDVPAEPTRVRDDVPLYAAEIDPDTVAGGPFGVGGGVGSADEDAGFDEGVGDTGGANPFEGAETPFGGTTDADGTEGPAGGNPFDDPGGPGSPGGLGGLGDLLGDDAGPLAGGPMPGADEAAAMQQLLAYLDDPRFDRVVVDTAPTGHTLRLLELPEVMDTLLGRLVSLRDRLGGMVDGLKGVFGVGSPDVASADLDELRGRIERLRAVLRDPERTDFRVVTVPEEMSVVETVRLVDRLDGFGIPVQTVVVNRVMENLADVTDVGAADAGWVVSPNLDDCEFCQRRWQVQQRALRRATDLFRGRAVKRVPLLADDVRGEAALRVVAACLA